MKLLPIWSGAARAFVLATLACSAPAVHAASQHAEEHACRGDALHFCKADVPDKAKITECMKQHYEQLSPACKAMFDHPQTGNRPNG